MSAIAACRFARQLFGLVLANWLLISGASATIARIDELYQESKSTSCSGVTNLCHVDFSVIPVSEQLIIEHASCTFRTNPGGVVAQLSLNSVTTANVTNGIGNQLNPVAFAANSSFRAFQVNEQVAVLITPGRKPRITMLLSTGDFTTAACNITGRIVAAPV